MTQSAGNPFTNANMASTFGFNNSGYNTNGDSVINGMYNTTNNTGSGCGCNR